MSSLSPFQLVSKNYIYLKAFSFKMNECSSLEFLPMLFFWWVDPLALHLQTNLETQLCTFCGPLIFIYLFINFTQQSGTEKALIQQSNSSVNVHAPGLLNLFSLLVAKTPNLLQMIFWVLIIMQSLRFGYHRPSYLLRNGGQDIDWVFTTQEGHIFKEYSLALKQSSSALIKVRLWVVDLEINYYSKAPSSKKQLLVSHRAPALLVLMCRSYFSDVIWSLWHNISQRPPMLPFFTDCVPGCLWHRVFKFCAECC